MSCNAWLPPPAEHLGSALHEDAHAQVTGISLIIDDRHGITLAWRLDAHIGRRRGFRESRQTAVTSLPPGRQTPLIDSVAHVG
jgi:hypothetical protein